MRPKLSSLIWALVVVTFLALFIVPLVVVSAQENTDECPTGYPTNITPNGSWGYGQPTDYQSIHTGLDFLAAPGTPVYATGSGEVVWNSTWPPGQGGYGTMVAIKHQCKGRTLYTMYGHLGSVNVNVGERVQAGQQIGGMGNTGAGRSSTGAQVHYEINTCAPTQGWACTSRSHLNPYDYMGKDGASPQSSINPGGGGQESGGGKVEVQPETQQVSARFNLSQPAQQPPQPPSTTSIFNAIMVDQKTSPQAWAILVGVIIAGILLANRKSFGFFLACCLLIWSSILLIKPTYAQQEQTYQEYVNYVWVTWGINVEEDQPKPPTEAKQQPPLEPPGGQLEGYPDHGKKANPPANCTPITIKVSHYWPPWGGPNCASFYNGYCYSRMASGKKWEDYTGYAVAMPNSVPFGTKVYAFGREWEVMDRGGAIIQNGNSYWIDFLHPKSLMPYGSLTQACIVYP